MKKITLKLEVLHDGYATDLDEGEILNAVEDWVQSSRQFGLGSEVQSVVDYEDE